MLTNSTGLHAICIPEHVLGQMLVLARNFHEAQRLQRRGEWNRFRDRLRQRRARADGSRLAILGAGPIGANLARMAAALGMRVRVHAARSEPPVAGAEQVCGPGLARAARLGRFRRPRGAAHRARRGADRRRRAARHAIRRVPDQHRARRSGGRGRAGRCLRRRGLCRRRARRVPTPSRCPPGTPSGRCPIWSSRPHVSGYTPTYFDAHAGDLRGQPGALPRTGGRCATWSTSGSAMSPAEADVLTGRCLCGAVQIRDRRPARTGDLLPLLAVPSRERLGLRGQCVGARALPALRGRPRA